MLCEAPGDAAFQDENDFEVKPLVAYAFKFAC